MGVVNSLGPGREGSRSDFYDLIADGLIDDFRFFERLSQAQAGLSTLAQGGRRIDLETRTASTYLNILLIGIEHALNMPEESGREAVATIAIAHRNLLDPAQNSLASVTQRSPGQEQLLLALPYLSKTLNILADPNIQFYATHDPLKEAVHHLLEGVGKFGII